MSQSPRDLYRNIRLLLEGDVDAGISFGPKVSALSPQLDATPQGTTAQAPQSASTPATEAPALNSSPAANSAPARPIFASDGSKAERLTALADQVAQCQRCGLCSGRTNTVPGEGSHEAELLFIGEGPGADEDAQGRPFVGPAGQLLDRMIRAMGLQRDEVFIANVVKCRPPRNRNPEPAEISACLPYLEEQVHILQPKIICTLGNIPLRALRGDDTIGITRARGKAFGWKGFTVLPTFHPSYLLRNEAAKKPAWEDLKQVVSLLGRELPKR